jgi:hypothetical protein
MAESDPHRIFLALADRLVSMALGIGMTGNI